MKFGVHIASQKKLSIPEYTIIAKQFNSVVSDFNNNIFILETLKNIIFAIYR